MTRKCVFCKGTNYKNTYSFFSAPKDAATRRRWEQAIGIENYSVTDDTYVCSKHFHRDDIITHWISGAPPHAITIKYKKCRLRPGAVPGRHITMEQSIHTTSHLRPVNIDTSVHGQDGGRQGFVISKTDPLLYSDQPRGYKAVKYRVAYALDGFELVRKERLNKEPINKTCPVLQASNKNHSLDQNTIQTPDDTISIGDLVDSLSSEDTRGEPMSRENSNASYDRGSTIRLFRAPEEEETSTDMWEQRSGERNSRDRRDDESVELQVDEMRLESQPLTTFDRSFDVQPFTAYREPEEPTEMLFEDLLEVYTDVLLPGGWSCLVTAKGHATTVVYMFMGMSHSGMPFTEKQVFIKSDMLLRCTAVNREINPTIHNLIRKGKHLKVRSLVDVEELIDEFDQRTVCEGIFSAEGLRITGQAYKDGIRWRHVMCPLLVNNDSTRCTRCITLSQTLMRRPKSSRAFRYNHLRQVKKRTRKHDRRYEFTKPVEK